MIDRDGSTELLWSHMEYTCGHCGLAGALTCKSATKVKRVEYREQDVAVDTVVEVYFCAACDEPVIFQTFWSDEVGETWGEKMIYPSVRDNDALPARVRTRLESASRVKRIDPSMYAVAIRRVIEAVCNDEQAAGNDLFSKLDDLVSKGRIPAPLAESAHQLRQLGNLGAHDEEVEVDAADVPAIEALSDSILEYLYRAPATLKEVKASVDGRRTAT